MSKPYCLEHIPPSLLSLNARPAFLRWLASLSLHPIERKSCLLAWAAHLGYKLTRADVLAAHAE